MDYIHLRLQFIRNFRGWSMGQVQGRVGITKQSISKFESGYMKPAIDTLDKLANFYEVPTEFFFKENVEIKISGKEVKFN